MKVKGVNQDKRKKLSMQNEGSVKKHLTKASLISAIWLTFSVLMEQTYK